MSYDVGDLVAVRDSAAEPPEVPEGEAAKKIEGRSPWRLAMQRLRRDRAAMIALGVIILIILMAIFAPLFATITGRAHSARPAGRAERDLPVRHR